MKTNALFQSSLSLASQVAHYARSTGRCDVRGTFLLDPSSHWDVALRGFEHRLLQVEDEQETWNCPPPSLRIFPDLCTVARNVCH